MFVFNLWKTFKTQKINVFELNANIVRRHHHLFAEQAHREAQSVK